MRIAVEWFTVPLLMIFWSLGTTGNFASLAADDTSDYGAFERSSGTSSESTGAAVVDFGGASVPTVGSAESWPTGGAEMPQAEESALEIPRPQDKPKSALAPDADDPVDAAAAYQAAQSSGTLPEPHFYDRRQYTEEGDEESPIGIAVRNDSAKLAGEQEIPGVAVRKVRPDSPAARAGLQSYKATTQTVLDGVAVAAAVVFPPAIVAIALIEQSRIGESYDLIIGIDGRRVRDIFDFDEATRDLKAGQIVYLTVVRSGRRVQVAVSVPTERSYATCISNRKPNGGPAEC